MKRFLVAAAMLSTAFVPAAHAGGHMLTTTYMTYDVGAQGAALGGAVGHHTSTDTLVMTQGNGTLNAGSCGCNTLNVQSSALAAQHASAWGPRFSASGAVSGINVTGFATTTTPGGHGR